MPNIEPIRSQTPGRGGATTGYYVDLNDNGKMDGKEKTYDTYTKAQNALNGFVAQRQQEIEEAMRQEQLRLRNLQGGGSGTGGGSGGGGGGGDDGGGGGGGWEANSRPGGTTRDGVYTVASGDTLGLIAKANNMTVEELMRINGITNPNRISVGQQIRLTGGSASTSSDSTVSVEDAADIVRRNLGENPDTPAPAPPSEQLYDVVDQWGGLVRNVRADQARAVANQEGITVVKAGDGQTIVNGLNIDRMVEEVLARAADIPTNTPHGPVGSRVKVGGQEMVVALDGQLQLVSATSAEEMKDIQHVADLAKKRFDVIDPYGGLARNLSAAEAQNLAQQQGWTVVPGGQGEAITRARQSSREVERALLATPAPAATAPTTAAPTYNVIDTSSGKAAWSGPQGEGGAASRAEMEKWAKANGKDPSTITSWRMPGDNREVFYIPNEAVSQTNLTAVQRASARSSGAVANTGTGAADALATGEGATAAGQVIDSATGNPAWSGPNGEGGAASRAEMERWARDNGKNAAAITSWKLPGTNREVFYIPNEAISATNRQAVEQAIAAPAVAAPAPLTTPTLINTESKQVAWTGPQGEGGSASKATMENYARQHNLNPADVTSRVLDGRTVYYIPGQAIDPGNVQAIKNGPVTSVPNPTPDPVFSAQPINATNFSGNNSGNNSPYGANGPSGNFTQMGGTGSTSYGSWTSDASNSNGVVPFTFQPTRGPRGNGL